MKYEAITPQIVKISCSSTPKLATMFLRFQEHYESPEWRGKVFTIGQLRAWYASKYGTDTYERDWSGFNIPSYVLKPFIEGLFDPLTKDEQALLKLFARRTDNFYVIGSNDGDATLDHELAHALWYVNGQYKRECLRVINEHSKDLKPLEARIKSMMYHPSVILDEVHAYTSADAAYVRENWKVPVPEAAHVKLKKLREIHLEKSKK